MTRRGFRRDFLNDYGGVFWLDVSGRTQRPPVGGSAYNDEEVAAIEEIIPRLIENLSDSHGLRDVTIGIVSPIAPKRNA